MTYDLLNVMLDLVGLWFVKKSPMCVYQGCWYVVSLSGFRLLYQSDAGLINLRAFPLFEVFDIFKKD